MATQGSALSIFQNVPRSGDRRRTIRQKIHSPAYASFDGIGGGMVLDLTEITDIGEAGLSLHTAAALAPNSTLNLVLDLSETKTYINTTGYVVWTHPSGRAGIRFSKMPDASRLQLQRWLFFNAMAGAAKALENPDREEREGTPEVQTPAPAVRNPLSDPAVLSLVKPVLQAEPSLLAADAPTLNAIQQQVDSLGADTFAALQFVVERAQAMTRSSGAAIALAEGTEMVCRASSGDAPPIGARFQVGSGFSGECVRTAKLQRCNDAETDPVVDRESCRRLGIRSMVAAPILLSNDVVGLLEVFSPHPHAFEETDANALRRLSNIVAGVSEKQAEKTRELAELATAPHSEELTFEERSSIPNRKLIIAGATCIVLLVLISLVLYWSMRRAPASATPQAIPANTSKTPQPESSSLESLSKYAMKGDPVAQFALGARYAQGDGVKQDYAEALQWFTKAAEQGHVVAQATLGAYYWAGRGTQQDLVKAYFWSALARAGGDEASKYRVAALTSRMTHAQVLAAQQQAERWLREHQAVNQAAR